MKLFAELRIFGFDDLPADLRRKVPPIFRLEGKTLTYRGHVSALTLSEWLKEMWPWVNHQRDWIKTALSAGASGELFCFSKNLEEEIVFEPEALTICTSLGVRLRISKRSEKATPNRPNKSPDRTPPGGVGQL